MSHLLVLKAAKCLLNSLFGHMNLLKRLSVLNWEFHFTLVSGIDSIRPYVQALFSNCNLRIYTISVNLTIEILHASSHFSVKSLNVMSRISLHVKPVICLIKG